MKRLSIFFAALMACTLSFAAEVTYDFTTNGWKLPTDYTKTAATYTNADGYSISFGKSNSGHKFGGTYLIFGESGATLTFNSLNKNVTSVAITGNKGASTAVTWTFSANSTQIGDAQTGAQGTYTFDIPAAQQAADNTYTIKVTNAKNMQITKVVFTYESADPDAIDKPTFTPADGDFVGSVEVTLAAGEGLDIYYTLDGTDPTTASTKYTAPFTLTETKTVKAIAYNATTKKASEVAEKTYTAQKLMTCADANAAKDGDAIFLNEVTVVYADGANIYVADATGTTLVFSWDFKDKFKAGQVVKGIKGTISIYGGLPEIKPSVALADLTITDGGTVPAPEAVTAVPTMDDINKYVRLDKVAVSAATWTSESKQSAEERTLVGKFLGEDVTLYNTFKIDQTFKAGDYEIIGFVTCYKGKPQIAVVSAKPAAGTPSALDAAAVAPKAQKRIINGVLVIEKDGVLYNAQGAKL